jgi:hypothetical protein
MNIRNKNLVLVILGLGFFVIAGSAFSPAVNFQKRNLKVLPKNISNEMLDSIMNGFEHALGVKCDFCHAKTKEDATKLEYASDDKPEKEIARKMMIMTAEINKKYFNYNDTEDPEIIQSVFCITCHRGEPHPEFK